MDIRLMTIIMFWHELRKRRRRDFSQAAEVINKYSPDILGLNEVHYTLGFSNFDKQAEVLNKMLDYKYMYYGRAGAIKEGYQGNTLFSKFPIKTAHTVLVDQPAICDEDTYYEQRSFIDSVIDIGIDIRVIVTHFGLAKGERKNELDMLIPIFKDYENPLIFMGDLNVEPEDPQLKMVADILFDTANTSKEHFYTFPSDAPDRKIDYIFVSHGMNVKEVLVPFTLASDHLPYIADISL